MIDIYLFGVEWFGPKQALGYQAELENCFAILPAQPRMGRPADMIAPGLWQHEHGSYVILYREETGGILVVAVVHGRSLHGLEL